MVTRGWGRESVKQGGWRELGPEKGLELEEHFLIKGQSSSGLTTRMNPIEKAGNYQSGRTSGTSATLICLVFITVGLKPYLTSWINYETYEKLCSSSWSIRGLKYGMQSLVWCSKFLSGNTLIACKWNHVEKSRGAFCAWLVWRPALLYMFTISSGMGANIFVSQENSVSSQE